MYKAFLCVGTFLSLAEHIAIKLSILIDLLWNDIVTGLYLGIFWWII